MEKRESPKRQLESLLAAKAKIAAGVATNEDFSRYWRISDELEKHILDELAKS